MTHPDGLKGGDHPFAESSWPSWFPWSIEAVIRDLTYDEAHGMLLSTFAWPLTVFWVFGSIVVDLFVGVIALLILSVVLFELPRESETAKLLSSDTWYFLVPFVFQSGAAFLFLGVLV